MSRRFLLAPSYAIALLLVVRPAAAAQVPPGDSTALVLTYAEVENPAGPRYYDPVLYRDAPFTGVLVDRRADGRLAAWKQVRDGRVDGWWLEWFPGGALRYRGHWTAGVQDGVHAYFYANGLPREVGSKRGEAFEGLATAYLPDGRVAQRCGYLDGAQVGPCLEYAEVPAALPVEWGEPSGREVATEFYPGGRPRLWREEDAEGRADGRWLEWLPDGTLRFRSGWRAGLGEGAWAYFHDDGRLRQLGVYRADTLVGDELQFE